MCKHDVKYILVERDWIALEASWMGFATNYSLLFWIIFPIPNFTHLIKILCQKFPWYLDSDNTCDAPLLGSKKDTGTEWSDENCALIHGPVTGVRMWESSSGGYIKSWVGISSLPNLNFSTFLLLTGKVVQVCIIKLIIYHIEIQEPHPNTSTHTRVGVDWYCIFGSSVFYCISWWFSACKSLLFYDSKFLNDTWCYH